jgi:hypothetical protein
MDQKARRFGSARGDALRAQESIVHAIDEHSKFLNLTRPTVGKAEKG